MRENELQQHHLMRQRVIAYMPKTKSVFAGMIIGGSKYRTKVRTDTGVDISLDDHQDYAIAYDQDVYDALKNHIGVINQVESDIAELLHAQSNVLRSLKLAE